MWGLSRLQVRAGSEVSLSSAIALTFTSSWFTIVSIVLYSLVMVSFFFLALCLVTRTNRQKRMLCGSIFVATYSTKALDYQYFQQEKPWRTLVDMNSHNIRSRQSSTVNRKIWSKRLYKLICTGMHSNLRWQKQW